jgi:hypothetical protein
MFKFIRNSKITKGLAVYFSLSIVFQLVSPTVALALTSGPGQEEFASFEPASTSDMVDLYTGDYNYNIPLLSVPGPNGGYPINIAYHSGIGMEQEASWVGLGWTLNVGAISRNLRGLPDDFNGDAVTKTQHIKESVTASLDIPTKAYKELVGFPTGTESSSGGSSSSSVGQKLQLYYNNYRGMGTRYSIEFSGSSPLGLSISSDSQNGMGIGLTFSSKNVFESSELSAGFSLGANYNSRQGLESFNFSSKVSYSKGAALTSDERNVAGTFGGGSTSTLSFATVFSVPKTNIEMTSTTVPFKLRIGSASELFRFKSPFPISGSVFTSTIENKGVDNVPAVGYLNTNGQANVLKDFNRADIVYSKKIPHLGTSSFTYDLYTQTGQGTGSMFRPYLNTFGVLSNPQKISKDFVKGLGQEFGVGGSLDVHVGIDFEYGDGQNSSGPWTQIGDYSDYGPQLQKLINWNTASIGVDYEPYYFQVIGEKTGTPLAEDQLNGFRGDLAVRIELQKERQDKSFLTRHFKASDYLITRESEVATASLDGNNQTKQKLGHKRAKRSTSIETLTTAQASHYGYSKNLTYKNTDGVTMSNKDFTKPSHHVSEISMLQADGMRYVYGLPAYNNKQVDNSFAVTAHSIGISNVTDVAVNEGGTNNYGGINVTGTYDQYVSKNELPAYAHSWMLTTVLSADYLDMTNNGPTDDDFGYWVKFNYKKAVDNYKWRIPFSQANFMDGFKNDENDNKGSYTYGEKDIYVLESIETKTHIAVFATDNRRDGFEATGEFSNGTGAAARGPNSMKKLNTIKLFTKREYAGGGTPVPTKVINFEYSYDLCPEVPNNDQGSEMVDGVDVNTRHGKLTLTKLYFTYQNSTRGKVSPYVFNYGVMSNSQDNPAYNKNDMDRWGNYKNHKVFEVSPGFITYPYTDRPYTDQDELYANTLKPAPWTLKEIALPTGGTLKMDYESDDYAYVENKQAMRMFDICGLDKPGSGGFISLSDLEGQANRNIYPNAIPTEAGTTGGGLNRVYFKLEKPMAQMKAELGLSSLTDKDALYELYLKNAGEYIYFNIYANLKKEGVPDEQFYDNVKGYAEIDIVGSNYGVTSVNAAPLIDEQYGYFTVKNQKLSSPINSTGIWASPFTIAALQHLKANRSELVYTAMPYPGTSAGAQVLALFNALPGQLTDLMATTIGFNNYAYLRNWGQQIQSNGRSIIRLCEPDYKKIGGGVRVKKITFNDNWKNDPAIAANSSYGQEYFYTKTTSIAGKQSEISSGVAYEPQVGGEESALRTSIPYVNSIPLHGIYNLFMENPIMESYYPGAGVGYSKVTVKSIAPTQALAENPSNPLAYSSAPITINEFYTPKDFPLMFDKTDMNPGQPIRIPIMIPGIMSNFTTRQAKSQGYSIVMNDMAGKPKAVTTQTKTGGQIISKQKFIYNTETDYNEDAVNKLSSKVQTLEVDKTDNYKVKYITSLVGQTHDMFIDMDEDSQEMESFGLETNFDLHYTSPYVLLFVFIPIPTVHITKSSMRTVVFNKIINRTGVLNKVEVTTNGSKITTENLAYDIETGEALLTKVTNEFKDPVYNFNYPGHWYYPNLAGAYKNVGLTVDPAGASVIASDASTGYLNLSSVLDGRPVTDFFAKGDLLFVNCATGYGSTDGEYHVLSINETTSSILLMNSSGHLFPTSIPVESLKVLKSGFKNMQSSKVGSLVFKTMNPTFKPYVPSNDAGTIATTLKDVLYPNLTDNKIVNASAIQYNNNWQVFCGPGVPAVTECVCNLTPSAYHFLSMIQSLKESNLLFSEDVELHDMVTGDFSNGFSADLLNASSKLLSIKSTVLASILTPKKFYYQGYLSGNDLRVLVHHDPTGAILLGDFAKADCGVLIDLPAGETWENVQSFSDITLAPPTGGTECISPSGIYLKILKDDGTYITATVTVQCTGGLAGPCSNCWIFEECYAKVTPNYACGIQVNEPVNPYLAGMKGMWRPEASYAYTTARTQANNLQEDGIFTDFVRFPWEDPALKDAKWINATTVTKYSPYGFELENKDALGNYSSALYGYKQSLVTAIGANAKYNELAFDNFEDYPLGCNDRHFKFSLFEANITTTQAHTGKRSMSVAPSSSVNVVSSIADACAYVPIDDKTNPTPRLPYLSVKVAHLVNSCDCLGTFSPLANKKYVISAWVKELNLSESVSSGATNYTAPQLKVTIATSGAPVVLSFISKGNVIDGWQQIFESFDIPAGALGITVELKNTLATKNVYFDDVRIHPFDGNMVSYVYDPITLKTMAELDANNYATIYVYDDEGHLNKVKKETTEGIKTIKEGRVNTKKINE